jgi:ribosomal-protein-alanine N-acetyltransferase
VTPAALAHLHKRAFRHTRPWSEDEFHQLLQERHTELLTHTSAFVLIRHVVDEAEILTIATDPNQQRQGLATALLRTFDDFCNRKGIARAFLEVSAENSPAIGLYKASGFTQIGTRTGYYRLTSGQQVDALLFEKCFPGA